jgi:hypothetical protein
MDSTENGQRMTGATKHTARLSDFPGDVLTVAQAGLVLGGLSKDSAYAAVHRGEIPTIRLVRKLLVPRAALAAMLGIDDGDAQPKTDEEMATA